MEPYTVITGASDGLGKEIALQLGYSGQKLVLVARRTDSLEAIARDIREHGGPLPIVISADLSTRAGTTSLLSEIADIPLDTLILAAGFGGSSTFHKEAKENISSMIDLNCSSVALTVREVLPRFIEQNNGRIVLFSSIVSFQGTGFSALYAATKGFIQSLGEGIREETRHLHISTLIAAPGPVTTGFADNASMTYSGSMPADIVAREIIKNIGKNKTIYPGRLSKILKFALSIAPRQLRVKIMTNIMKSMSA